MYDARNVVDAVIGPIPEDRNMWRINWLKSLLDGFDSGELVISQKCDDHAAAWDAIGECREMVREVNAALAGYKHETV